MSGKMFSGHLSLLFSRLHILLTEKSFSRGMNLRNTGKNRSVTISR